MGTKKEQTTIAPVSIYILTNGVHTDIVVPLRNEITDWSKEVKFSNTISKDTAFNLLSLGWGDRAFYMETPTWADLKASTALKAAFGLSRSAVHATFYKRLNEDSTCVRINLSTAQYSRLVKYIENSFSKDSSGHFIPIITNANYDNNDAFYEAKGSYHLFYTCNTWANNALKSCGQKASVWTPFDKGIFYQYHK